MQGCDNTKCFFQYPANCYRFVICYLCFHVLFFGVFLLENISNSISLSQSSTQVGVLVTVSVIVRETFHDGVARLPNTGFFFVRALFYVPFTLSIMFYYLRMSDIFWLFFFFFFVLFRIRIFVHNMKFYRNFFSLSHFQSCDNFLKQSVFRVLFYSLILFGFSFLVLCLVRLLSFLIHSIQVQSMRLRFFEDTFK